MEKSVICVTYYVIPNARKSASRVWIDYQTHMRVRNWWKKFKNHESNYLHPENIWNWGKKTTAQSTSDLLPKHQTSEFSLKTSEVVTLKHIIHVCTLGRPQLCDV